MVLRIRAVERRVDGHDDDLEAVRQRIARREGQAGRAVQVERKQALEGEIAAVLEASRAPRKPVKQPDGDLDDQEAARLLSQWDMQRGRDS